MYKIEILPIAKKDVDNIIYYISYHLKNLIASRKLRDLFINGLNHIMEFPYSNPVYKPTHNLKYEYRSYKIKNFLIFYTIDEKNKIITIVRVLYQKMDISNILK